MPELLKFEYKRILKSKLIWFMVAYAFLCPVFAVIVLSFLIDFMFNIDLDDVNFSSSNFKFITWFIISYFYVRLPLIIGLFSGLFVGRDYSDGFIRNKITAGHTRFQIYFSTLITQLTVNVGLCIIYIIAGILALAISPFELNLNNGEMLIRAFTLILALAVLTTFFTALALNIKAKAWVIVISALFVMAMGPVSSIVSNYSYSSKLIDNYIEACEEKVEEIEQMSSDYEGYYYVPEVPERKDFINLPWLVLHPVYLLTNAGIESDLLPATNTSSFMSDDPFSYRNKVSRSGFANSILAAFSGVESPLDFNEINKVKGMEVRVSDLIPVYIAKSLIWSCIISAGGYMMFRKKNIN